METKSKNFHRLTIKSDQISLDDFEIRGVKAYGLKKNSANSVAELLIVLDVASSIVKK